MASLMLILTCIPYILLSDQALLTKGIKLVMSLTCGTAMSFGCQLIFRFEATGTGIQWRLLFSEVSPDDPFTLADVFFMLGLDSLLYCLLSWYIEELWLQPWYFPFTVRSGHFRSFSWRWWPPCVVEGDWLPHKFLCQLCSLHNTESCFLVH